MRKKTTENCPICGATLSKTREGDTVYYECPRGIRRKRYKHGGNFWKQLRPGEGA
jgi:hypothetical protein